MVPGTLEPKRSARDTLLPRQAGAPGPRVAMARRARWMTNALRGVRRGDRAARVAHCARPDQRRARPPSLTGPECGRRSSRVSTIKSAAGARIERRVALAGTARRAGNFPRGPCRAWSQRGTGAAVLVALRILCAPIAPYWSRPTDQCSRSGTAAGRAVARAGISSFGVTDIPRKTNYDFERREREKAKAAEAAKKLQAKANKRAVEQDTPDPVEPGRP